MTASVRALLERLADGIDEETAAKVDRCYELRFVGKEERWYLDLRRPKGFLSRKRPDGALCSLGMHVEDLDALLEGAASLSSLFSTMRLRVFDDIGDAMRLEAVFEARASAQASE